MKKFLLICSVVILRVITLPAQTTHTGWNGPGFFDVYPPEVKEWLGGDYTLRFRPDKEAGAPRFVDSVISLNNYYEAHGKSFSIVYCAGLQSTSVEDNIFAIEKLINAGVNILCVEMDNEPYNNKICNFDFECYKQLFEPLVNQIKQHWPDLPVSYFLAPRPKESGVNGGSKDHSNWNNACIQYLKDFAQPEDQVSIHIYFNGREISILSDSTLYNKRAYDPDAYYSDLDEFNTNLFYQGFESIWLWDSTLQYLTDYFPDRLYNVTEFGIDNSGEIKNTICYHALMSAIWNSYKFYPGLYTMLEHTGNAKGGAGCINPASEKFDFNPNGYICLQRLAVPTWQMQYLHPGKSDDVNDPVIMAGNYQYHFSNMAALGNWLQLQIDTSLKFESGYADYVSGTNSYSSMGACYFMGPGTIKNYEIVGYDSVNYASLTDLYVPAWSYGYINFTVSKKVYPVIPPCKKLCSRFGYTIFHWKKCKDCQ